MTLLARLALTRLVRGSIWGGEPDHFLNTDTAAESTLLLPGRRSNVTLHRFFRFVQVLRHVAYYQLELPLAMTAPDAELSGRFAVMSECTASLPNGEAKR